MIIFLYGPNEYGRSQKAQELVDSKRAQYPDAPYKLFWGDDEKACENIESFVFESGLFSEGKKIALVSNPAACVSHKEDLWKRICARAQKDDILFILSQHATSRNAPKIFELVEGVQYKAQFFKEYTDAEAIKVILEKAQRLHCLLDRTAAARIYAYAAKNMFGAVQEIRRLALLGVPITPAFLRSLPEYGESIAIYEFARAVSYGTDMSQRLTLWEYMRAQRVDPYLLFGYLAKMARNTSLIADLARADEMVKSGRLEIEQALEKVIIGG